MSYEFINIGFFTTDKKSQNKQITNLVQRLEAFGEFNTTVVPSSYLDNTPINDWPIFDILIPYHLNKGTIQKVKEFILKRQLYVFNDLDMQRDILDRKFIYETMKMNDIPCLDYIFYDHSSPASPAEFTEGEDFIEVDGKRLDKPFVEKPLSARRHDINIYYNRSQGGGTRKLFRKLRDTSSKFFPELDKVRRDGPYIYERLIKTEKDVKVYAVLKNYSYAENRKSPNVDGIVDRNSEGFEIREFCPLTYEEVKISKKVIKAFKQNICGFDIIRDNQSSYVIDVNGMSFVKYNLKYYDDASHILREHFLKEMKKVSHPFYQTRINSRRNIEISGIVDRNKADVLLGVVTLFRHGDRTTKQKVKIESRDERLLSMLGDRNGARFKEKKDFDRVRGVLEEILGELRTTSDGQNGEIERKIKIAIAVLERAESGTKLQLKPKHNATPKEELILICKWGGILTKKGKTQCKRYAEMFKELYKGLEDFEKVSTPKLSTRNAAKDYGKVGDKKSRVYASDETRVKESARIFVDTLTGKKNRVEIKSSEEIEIFLNLASKADSLRQTVMKSTSDLLNAPEENRRIMDQKDIRPLMTEGTLQNRPWILRSYKRLQDPRKRLKELHKSLCDVTETIGKFAEKRNHYSSNGETITEIGERWDELKHQFYRAKRYNVSKVNEMYDFLRYDLAHNFEIFKSFKVMHKHLSLVCDFLGPAEYGITNGEKLEISRIIVKNLLEKFLQKLRLVQSDESEHKTFIFFASESMLHCLRNFLLQCRLASNITVFENFDKTEFNYMSHVIIRLYEDTVQPQGSPMRYYVNIMFSPGVWGDPFLHIDQRNFQKDKREILNPLMAKIGFEKFCEIINDNINPDL